MFFQREGVVILSPDTKSSLQRTRNEALKRKIEAEETLKDAKKRLKFAKREKSDGEEIKYLAKNLEHVKKMLKLKERIYELAEAKLKECLQDIKAQKKYEAKCRRNMPRTEKAEATC